MVSYYIGRLVVTKEMGLQPETGEYDALYTFGGRSFSIFKAETMQLVYDSGDHIGKSIATQIPEFFNMNYDSDVMMNLTRDKRSDNKVCLKQLN